MNDSAPIPMPPDPREHPVEGRWYEFEQRETVVRAYYVKAGTLAEARERVRSGGYEGDVSDYVPGGSHDFRIVGPGRLAPDQESVDALEAEGGHAWGTSA